MSETAIQLWGVIGTWVAGIGTVSAVIVSLWLAYHQGRARLIVNAGHRLIITQGSKVRPEYCVIKVVNRGNRPANITSIGWEAGRFKNKKHFVQALGTPGFDDVPKVLHEGEEANFMIPFRLNGDDKDWVVLFPKYLADPEGKTRYIKQLRVVVATSVGQMFRVRPEKNLVKKLLESYEANKAN